MEKNKITLVQKSFYEIIPISHKFSAMFYDRLFELDPSVRSLFKGDMHTQGLKLISSLSIIVHCLNKPESILADLQYLGASHVEYGVEPRHYDLAGSALLWTLEKCLGSGFTPELKTAWTEAYLLLVSVMKEGAAKAVVTKKKNNTLPL